MNLDHETDTTEPLVSLWRWFWLLVCGVLILTLTAIAAIANRVAYEHLIPGQDWPQCCDHWKAKRASGSKHLIY